MDVYTGLLDEPFDSDNRAESTAGLLAAGFAVDIDDAGWIAEYSAGYHRIRVESVPGGWLVSHVRVVGSLQRPYDEAFRSHFDTAADLALGKVAELNKRLRLIGSVAGPLLAELRRTS